MRNTRRDCRRDVLRAAVLAAVALGGARATGEAQQASAAVRVRTIEMTARQTLTENSSAAMSRSQPGVLFTINDSGHDPVLFAIDTTGADRGAWRIENARNNDWEAVAIGPCGDTPRPGSTGNSRTECLYIGDVGDNNARRATRVIYRVSEPLARESGFTGSLRAERLEFRYSDGPHDVEAMIVAPNGTVALITKRRLRDARGRARQALVFELPPDAWTRPGGRPVVAQLVDSLPIVPGSAPGAQITDAALSSAGNRLAVRTYRQVHIFATDSATGRVQRGQPHVVCDITALRERQGEGITWMPDATHLLLTSEGRRSPMHVIACGGTP
ncbi:MAG TPA: hypothetical protein VF178_16065 [Gemmatimonadaceae bacterium]